MSKESRAKRLECFNKRMDEFQQKVNEMAEARETKIDMRDAMIDNKLHMAQEKRDARRADFNTKKANAKDSLKASIYKVSDAIDDAKANLEAKKDARDQKKLEKYIDDRLDYAIDCISVAILALDEANVAFYEAAEAQLEYMEKYEN
jgi:hypothetical protein